MAPRSPETTQSVDYSEAPTSQMPLASGPSEASLTSRADEPVILYTPSTPGGRRQSSSQSVDYSEVPTSQMPLASGPSEASLTSRADEPQGPPPEAVIRYTPSTPGGVRLSSSETTVAGLNMSPQERAALIALNMQRAEAGEALVETMSAGMEQKNAWKAANGRFFYEQNKRLLEAEKQARAENEKQNESEEAGLGARQRELAGREIKPFTNPAQFVFATIGAILGDFVNIRRNRPLDGVRFIEGLVDRNVAMQEKQISREQWSLEKDSQAYKEHRLEREQRKVQMLNNLENDMKTNGITVAQKIGDPQDMVEASKLFGDMTDEEKGAALKEELASNSKLREDLASEEARIAQDEGVDQDPPLPTEELKRQMGAAVASPQSVSVPAQPDVAQPTVEPELKDVDLLKTMVDDSDKKIRLLNASITRQIVFRQLPEPDVTAALEVIRQAKANIEERRASLLSEIEKTGGMLTTKESKKYVPGTPGRPYIANMKQLMGAYSVEHLQNAMKVATQFKAAGMSPEQGLVLGLSSTHETDAKIPPGQAEVFVGTLPNGKAVTARMNTSVANQFSKGVAASMAYDRTLARMQEIVRQSGIVDKTGFTKLAAEYEGLAATATNQIKEAYAMGALDLGVLELANRMVPGKLNFTGWGDAQAIEKMQVQRDANRSKTIQMATAGSNSVYINKQDVTRDFRANPQKYLAPIYAQPASVEDPTAKSQVRSAAVRALEVASNPVEAYGVASRLIGGKSGQTTQTGGAQGVINPATGYPTK